MEQLDALIDKLVTQFVAQVRPVLAIELAKVKERNEKISVLEAANFELRQTIEGFERAHKIKLEKPSLVAPLKIEPKKELDESIEISDDGDDDDDATMEQQKYPTARSHPKYCFEIAIWRWEHWIVRWWRLQFETGATDVKDEDKTESGGERQVTVDIGHVKWRRAVLAWNGVEQEENVGRGQ